MEHSLCKRLAFLISMFYPPADRLRHRSSGSGLRRPDVFLGEPVFSGGPGESLVRIFTTRRMSATVLGFLLAALPLRGATPEELLFEDIPTVVTPARAPQHPWEAPASVDVYTAQTIEDWGVRSVADLLRRVPGMDVRQFGRYHQVGPRGTANVLHIYNVLILLDGVPVNDPLLGTFDLGPDFPVDTLQRVEVVRGPGSSLYGANAYAGVVNLITRTGSSDPGTRVRGAVGQGGLGLLSVTSGEPSLDGERLVSVRGLTMEAREQHAVNDNDWYDDLDALATVRSGRLDGTAWVSDSKQGRPYVDLAPDPLGYHTNETRFLRMRWRLDASEKQDLALCLHGVTQRGTFPGATPDDRVGYEGDRVGLDLQFVHSHGPGRRTVAGLEYTDKSGSWADVGGDQDSYERAAFFQEELPMGPDWRLTLGARVDDDSIFGTNLSPRVTALRTANPRRTVRVSWGRAFRAPTYSEQFIDKIFPSVPVNIHALGNPNLQPEEVTSFEAALMARPSKRLQWSLTLFRMNSSNRIGSLNTLNPLVPELVTQVVNGGGGTTRGIEAVVTRSMSERSRLTLAYTWQDPRNDADETLPYAPRNTANLTLTADLADRWRAFLGVRAVSERTTDFHAGAVPAGYATVDLRLARPISPHADVALTVYNLADLDYYETFAYPMPGRAAVVEFISRF